MFSLRCFLASIGFAPGFLIVKVATETIRCEVQKRRLKSVLRTESPIPQSREDTLCRIANRGVVAFGGELGQFGNRLSIATDAD